MQIYVEIAHHLNTTAGNKVNFELTLSIVTKFIHNDVTHVINDW